MGLNTGNFKNQQARLWESWSMRDQVPTLKESTTNSSAETQQRSSLLKNAWGVPAGDLFTNCRACARGAEVIGRIPQEQRSWRVPFSCPTLPAEIRGHLQEPAPHQHFYLIFSVCPTPVHFFRSTPPYQACVGRSFSLLGPTLQL